MINVTKKKIQATKKEIKKKVMDFLQYPFKNSIKQIEIYEYDDDLCHSNCIIVVDLSVKDCPITLDEYENPVMENSIKEYIAPFGICSEEPEMSVDYPDNSSTIDYIDPVKIISLAYECSIREAFDIYKSAYGK